MSSDSNAREFNLESAQGRMAAARRATEFAVEAGQLLLDYYGRLAASQIDSKTSARDLVTEADVESERLLVKRLRAEFPNTAIEAEEETIDAGSEEPRWFVDPLDGTVNFVHRLPAFCVSMGLYRGTQPLLGVVHAPLFRETFVGAAGAGAWVVAEGGACQPLQVSASTQLSDAVVATGFPYLRGELPNDNLGNFARLMREVRGVRRMGSAALDLALCAAGRLDAFWELHLGAHDLAAGALLVREAGGVVTDMDGGQDWLRSGQLIAGPEPLHAALSERVSARPEAFEPPAKPR